MARHRTTHRSAANASHDAARDADDRLRKEQALLHTEHVLGHTDSELVIPLAEEQVNVEKRTVETGRVAVTRVTRERSLLVEEPLVVGTLELSRVPIGRQVETMPAVRQEGNTTIVPIVEERLVVERRLFLKEEVRIRRVCTSRTHVERVNLRCHEVVVTRSPRAGATKKDEPEG